MTEPAKIDWPEAELAGGTPMALPEVSFGQVTGAGFASEAVETDYWQLTERTRRRYRGEALAKAEELIGGAFDAVPFERPRSYDPATGYGALEPWDSSTQMQQREELMLRLAKRKHPDEFAGLPTTDDEIAAAVTAELVAQYQDAQEVLAAAPESFMGATVPEFLGRVGTGATDEVGLPLAIASLGIGEMANVGRVIVTEAGLSVLGEAMTLPAQARMAERLGIEQPDATTQLAFAAAIGAGVPTGIYGITRGLSFGAGRLAGLSNREVVERLAKVPLLPEQRAAVQRIDTAAAEAEAGPQARPGDGPGAVDGAIEDMDEPGQPPGEGPRTDPNRVEAVMTPPAAPAPVPDLPPPPPAPGLPTPPAAPERVEQSLEQNLANMIVSAEAGAGGYDAFSDFSVVFPPKPVTAMTLDEIDAFQSANIEAGAASSAIGGPQFLRSTLRGLRTRLGLTGAEQFTPELQNRLAVELMRDAGLDDYRAGRLSADDFADQLAGVWAGLPLASGRSAYAGDGLNAATIDRNTVMAVIGGQEYQTAARAMPGTRYLPASTIQVDPRAYQFRTEVNEEGVGIGLDRVSHWSDMLAGEFIIHERLDGTRYVADGHHRLSLARRLEREGHAPIDVNARIFREADGYTVAEVRALAAVKNIEAGSASAVDAAKVLRDAPELMRNLSLRQAQVRDARGLMQLGDEAFDMVTAGVIREDFAAVVGEMTRDGTMQSAILRALIQAKPANQAEARQMAADAYRSGLARRDADAQGSLFGADFDVAETLFRERAKVMAQALAKLRKDRSVFNTLVRESNRIREAGNALTDETNLARVGVDEQALAIIERLANRAGPVDDALNSAAQAARTGRIADGVEQFLGVVRGAIERGELQSLIDGPPRSRGDGAQAPPRAPEGEGAGDQPDQVAAAEEALYRALLARETSPGRAAELTPAVLEAVEALRAALPRLDEFDEIRERIEQRAFAEADRQDAASGDLFGAPPTRDLEPEARIEDARLAAEREARATEAVTPAIETVAAEPPVPAGHVRMYHGGPPDSPGTGPGDAIWFSSNRQYAQDYRREEGVGSDLYFVDVPRSDPMFDADYPEQSVDRGFTVNKPFDPFAYGQVRKLEVRDEPPDMRPSVPPGTEGMVSVGENDWGEVFELPDGRRAYRDDDGTVTVEPEGADPDDRSAVHMTQAELEEGQAKFNEGIRAADEAALGELVAHLEAGGQIVGRGVNLKGPANADRLRMFQGRPQISMGNTRGAYRWSWTTPGQATALRDANVPRPPAVRRVREGRPTEATAAGEQTLIEGVAPVTDRQRAEAAQDRPMRGARAAAPMDEGLFDLGARGQMDLLEQARQPETPPADLWDDPDPDTPEFQAQVIALEDELADVIDGTEDFEVPVGTAREDEAGEVRAETITAREIIADMDDDVEFLGALDVCKP